MTKPRTYNKRKRGATPSIGRATPVPPAHEIPRVHMHSVARRKLELADAKKALERKFLGDKRATAGR
jgi:hypothetical protein